MALNGHDIYNQIHSPGDTTGLDAMGGGCGDLKSIHSEVANKLTESQTALNSFWKGQAAETGKAGLAPLIATSHIAAEKMDSMQKSIAEQSAAFNYVKNAVVPVAASRPDDQKLSDYVSLGASDDEIAAAEFDDKTKKNVEAYGQYQLSTDPRTQTMPVDYPAAHDPNVSATGITPDQQSPGTSSGRIGSGIGHHSSGGGSSHNYSSGPSSYSAPPGAAGMQAPPPPGHGGPVAPPVLPPGDGTRVSSWADPTPHPPMQTWQPPSVPPGGGNPGGTNSTFGPVSGFGGGFGPTSGGSGFGPGGSASGGPGGSGSGGAGPRGGGAGTGAGALGESAGAARPGAGGAGAAGAKGQPGMGGMGGGGKGGKGPEDEEHQRKILLAEDDPDSIFGGYDGGRPTPPVIGA
ncbi:hypothetical protein [Amycolatopsis silviterrae]|uniref:PPE domain-containing protein n=1 Tax=Amycolatopsis silviterrae TaxID=1656914 RepID=A0ABW5H5F7_9PSEU